MEEWKIRWQSKQRKVPLGCLRCDGDPVWRVHDVVVSHLVVVRQSLLPVPRFGSILPVWNPSPDWMVLSTMDFLP